MSGFDFSKLRGRHVAGLAGAIALAAFAITAFEGRVTTVYPDPVTHARPWTYCDGETQNPKPGHQYTNAECDAETAALVKKTDAAVITCVGNRPLPDNTRAAFDSLAWNIGTGGFCRSTVAVKAKAGDLKAACNAISLYDHAGGRTIPGLTARRGTEREMCLSGLSK